MARFPRCSAILCTLAAAIALSPAHAQSVTLGGITFSHSGLVGVGRVDGDKRDKQNETFGSLSGLALDVRTWQRGAGGTYSGTLYTQPDRGYVKSSVTTNYRPRRHKFTLTFKPDTNGSSKQDQLVLSLTETTLFAEADGTPLTSYDPTPSGSATRTGFPRLPQAFNNRLALDPEGLALLPDGTFFVSDEYGPYLYRLAANGTLLGATRPPEALIPKRNTQDSFSSASPAAGQPSPSPVQPDAGRENSQGLEGLTVSADGRTLYALMQSATRQDGGSGGSSLRRHTRLLEYNITNPAAPVLTGEWILPLPIYTQSGVQLVASVGDLVTLSRRHFLVLARDGNGRGGDAPRSLYRAVLVYDIGSATNIAGTAFDSPNRSAAPSGVIDAAITPATSAVLIDVNDATQLTKFNLNNSTNDNSDTLAEKWESLALAPALDPAAPDDFFLLVGNDNDFSTTNGFQDGSSYRAGLNIDTMVLAYRVTLPGTNTLPTITTQPASRTAAIGITVILTAAAMGSPTPTLQWLKDGVALAGRTGATLSLSGLTTADAGSYSVSASNSIGSVTSNTANLTVTGGTSTTPPAITAQPASINAAVGGSATLVVTATGSPSFQWRKNGSAIIGANGASFSFGELAATDTASYDVVLTNSLGTVTSSSATVIVSTPLASRLSNLSVRTTLAANQILTVGTSMQGGAKSLLVRAAGPGLGALGVPGTMANPRLALFSDSTEVAANDNWGGNPAVAAAIAAVGAFPFASTASLDAALVLSIDGVRTVQASGSTAGNLIVEAYDAGTGNSPRLTNLSARNFVGTGDNVLIAGFYIDGTGYKNVLIRAVGPTLGGAPFNIPGVLADPKLELFTANSTPVKIAENDNYAASLAATFAGVAAFALTPGSRDAALVINLPPGGYTVQVSGVNLGTGDAIVEVYELP